MKTYSNYLLILSILLTLITIITPIDKIEKTIQNQIIITEIKQDQAIGKIYKKPLSRKIQIENTKDLIPGNIIQVKGTLKIPKNNQNYLRSQNIYYILTKPQYKTIKQKKNYNYYKHKLKEKYEKTIKTLYKNQSPLIDSLITGNKTNLPKDQKDIIIKSGTAHLFSISGFHIGLLYLAINKLIKKTPMKMTGKDILALITLLLYISWCNFQISCTRAYLFIALYIISKQLKRKYNMLNTAKTLSAVTMLTNPYIIYSPGFCLSYLAVISIGMYNKKLKKLTQNINLNQNIKDILNITISAQILTLPYSYYKFKAISIISPITNLISINLISFTYIFIISSLILYPIRPLGKITANTAKILIKHLYLTPNKYLTKLPNSYIERPNPSKIKILIFYIIALSMYNIIKKKEITKNTIK